jgi:mRNA interferase MazF
MIGFGDIVLTRFPFTDLSGSKVRPALVISKDNARRRDVVLAFITSNSNAANIPDALVIHPNPGNGLKVLSSVRFDKIATLEARVIAGKLGKADSRFLLAARPVFFGIFGFGLP